MSRYVQTGRKHINWEAVEFSGVHKNGQEVPLEIFVRRVRRARRHFFTGIARDISERKRAETALKLLRWSCGCSLPR